MCSVFIACHQLNLWQQNMSLSVELLTRWMLEVQKLFSKRDKTRRLSPHVVKTTNQRRRPNNLEPKTVEACQKWRRLWEFSTFLWKRRKRESSQKMRLTIISLWLHRTSTRPWNLSSKKAKPSWRSKGWCSRRRERQSSRRLRDSSVIRLWVNNRQRN